MATTVETLSNFIDGERVPSSGETEPVLNPATGEELARAPRSSAEDVDRAVGAARRAFGKWSQTTPAQRSEALLGIANVLEILGPDATGFFRRLLQGDVLRKGELADLHSPYHSRCERWAR